MWQYPYPDQFPLEDIKRVIDFIRGRDANTSEVAHSAWVVSGYALGRIAPQGPGMITGVFDFDLVSLEPLLTSQPSDTHAAIDFNWLIDLLPWDKILAAVMEIIRKLLERP